ncbi:MAG: hypothetical protein ACRCY3_04670 [Sphingorhabdus sp.]
MTNDILNPKTAAWPASLAAATVLGSFALACVFPFAAFATLAALTMKPRTGLALVATVWGANQAVGFLLLSFPWEGQAVGHGIAILAATLAAFGIARFTAAKMGSNPFVRSVTALVSAFAIYQVLLRAYAQFGGGAENFSAQIIGEVALNDALWFAGLMALRFVVGQATGQRAVFNAAR